MKKGGPISWRPDEVFAGEMFASGTASGCGSAGTTCARSPAGASSTGWPSTPTPVGWPTRATSSTRRGRSPDGEIVALDGYIDAYFQEVYLDQEELPTFAKVVANVSGDALDDYVEQLEGEVKKYLGHPNYGKVAKRMYNVFRYSGRHLEAAYVRSSSTSRPSSSTRSGHCCGRSRTPRSKGSTLPEENVRAQADELVMTVVQALEGVQEEQVVKALLRLRSRARCQPRGQRPRGGRARARRGQGQLENVVNTFFQDRLVALPSIQEYIDSLDVVPGSGHH